MWCVLLPLVIGFTHAIVDHPRPTAISVEDEGLCKTGYYQDPDLDNCCSYHQCVDMNLFAFQRICAEPLVWNNVSCTCDWQESVSWCVPENMTTCWDWVHPTYPVCSPGENQCCQIGIENGQVDGRQGLLFTKVPTEGPGAYSYCSSAEDVKVQQCPLNGVFNLDTCCCEWHNYTDPSCLNWRFGFNYMDNKNNVPMKDGSTGFQHSDNIPSSRVGIRDASLRCFNGEPASIEAFAKAWWGDSFTFGVWFKCEDARSGGGCGDGVILDNGQDEEGKEVINSTLRVTIEDRDLRLRIVAGDTVFDQTVEILTRENTEWNFALVQMHRNELWFYWGTEEDLDFIHDNTTFTDQGVTYHVLGTNCPLKICKMFGQMDNLVTCHFPFTLAQIQTWQANADEFPHPPHSDAFFARTGQVNKINQPGELDLEP